MRQSRERDKVSEMKRGILIVCITVVLGLGSTAVADAKMYWTNYADDTIQRADLNGGNVEELVSTGLLGPHHIAIDASEGKMYWTDRYTDKIQRADLDGSNIEDLVTVGLEQPAGIALDTIARKMYWVDSGAPASGLGAKMQRANLDGTNVETLIVGLESNNPFGLAIDRMEGNIYWTNLRIGTIQKAYLDGSHIQNVIATGLDSPAGIALDLQAGKMYLTDYNIDKILRANLDGSNLEDLVTTGINGPAVICLDYEGGKMYWTGTLNDKIHRADFNGSNVETLVTGGIGAPLGIALIPEPATLTLLTLGGLALLQRRKRGRRRAMKWGHIATAVSVIVSIGLAACSPATASEYTEVPLEVLEPSHGLPDMAMKINEDGTIWGVSGGRQVRWDQGIVTETGGVSNVMHYKPYWAKTSNSHGQSIGQDQTLSGWPFYVQDGQDRRYFPLGFHPMEINEPGQVVGYHQVGAVHTAFVWEDEQVTYLPPLSTESAYSRAYGINDMGRIVGMSHRGAGHPTAVLWNNGEIQTLPWSGAIHAAAMGINNAGHIVGYSDTGTGHFFSLTSPILWVPEPATLSLLALGGLAVIRKRRKQVETRKEEHEHNPNRRLDFKWPEVYKDST